MATEAKAAAVAVEVAMGGVAVEGWMAAVAAETEMAAEGLASVGGAGWAWGAAVAMVASCLRGN